MAEYKVPQELHYSKDDEWVRQDGERCVIGISDYAQQQLGDIVFVELPAPGDTITKGVSCGVVESVKAVADLYAPLSGTVVAVNEALGDAPEKVNEDCYGEGWMLALTPANADELEALLGADAYTRYLAERD